MELPQGWSSSGFLAAHKLYIHTICDAGDGGEQAQPRLVRHRSQQQGNGKNANLVVIWNRTVKSMPMQRQTARQSLLLKGQTNALLGLGALGRAQACPQQQGNNKPASH